MRTVWSSAAWKYSPNRAVGRATHGQRQNPILIVQTQFFPFNDRLNARPVSRSVMSAALHDVGDDGLMEDSSGA